MKKKIIVLMLIIMTLIVSGCTKKENKTITIEDGSIDISSLTYNGESLKVYEASDYDSFISDYSNNSLPSIYVTKFLFDGVSKYKTYDLDDFTESGNDVEVKAYDGTVININNAGDYTFTGELKGGMLAVNTNGIEGNINIVLNNASIDTDSKKIPAIYVYNKDITYDKCKVSINTMDDSKNYIEGGKLKKISLIGSDELSNYSSKYSGSTYETYTNYYGIYTSSEISNILFAKVTADREDLEDNDPYYYYKASGAISSDIDLYFEGKGLLEVVSKNKEGIESKGNLSFTGGTGDYVIKAEDDCLNTTTDDSENSNAHNDLSINVNSLTAVVSNEADEGDAIDSNGTLTIDGGKIIAIAKTGQDAGIDSEKGIYINGGTVIATGDMYDQISSDSKQNFMILSFNGSVSENTLITLLDSEDNTVFGFQNDRTFSTLVFSSDKLVDGTYYLYQDGVIEGLGDNGLYLEGTYTKGTELGYSSQGTGMGGPGGPMNIGQRNGGPMNNNQSMNQAASNKEFTISGISNIFSGVAKYSN